MRTTYCGCPSETFEIDYDGTEDEFNHDHKASTEILNAIFNSEFPHYFMEIDFEEDNEEEYDDDGYYDEDY